MPEPLVLVMAAFALLSVVLLVTALAAVQRRRWMGTSLALVLAVLCLALAALAATVSVAMQGYRAALPWTCSSSRGVSPSWGAWWTPSTGRRPSSQREGLSSSSSGSRRPGSSSARSGRRRRACLPRRPGSGSRAWPDRQRLARSAPLDPLPLPLLRQTPAAAPRIPIDRGPCHARRGEDLAEQAHTRVRRALRIAEDARHARLDRLHLTVAEGERGRDRV